MNSRKIRFCSPLWSHAMNIKVKIRRSGILNDDKCEVSDMWKSQDFIKFDRISHFRVAHAGFWWWKIRIRDALSCLTAIHIYPWIYESRRNEKINEKLFHPNLCALSFHVGTKLFNRLLLSDVCWRWRWLRWRISSNLPFSNNAHSAQQPLTFYRTSYYISRFRVSEKFTSMPTKSKIKEKSINSDYNWIALCIASYN